MKKIFLIVLLLVIASAATHANTDRYRIFMEKAGFWGGSAFLMVDTETGQSWKYTGRMWEPIPRIEEEATGKPDISVVMAKYEEEIKTLNLKQVEEIKFIKARHEKEIADLKARIALVQKPIRAKRTASYQPRQIKIKAISETGNDPDDAPPAWLTEE
ncbi:hypothetical protein A3K48_07050 [candidate division WOR-1 bacterium RIFOXYA12_FULL_52_29]|uniref:Uncharacterized protein n=1 Tax=candidate division WOR-1 bacterium RIFOXYC12_FULL_54_18 TaxID=1802584 RepID=A0A1F4T7K7_UNCSA|nr:MAG: hypothetical protein A3K44_07050 [candidate division WOR-1 bacterium RIFOXYA2_FULL_51_19]OGC18277.1 MAG: hypothetical protein A3K48_07050 [candidate division WOR-1 bacterium RIFOXYA12_FULL_52_29]OGC27132.1 MAG: hypothetical protein A3K32_07045 [candidate division WOR-1 bacterium RIFOXYB2_FULL_45_9]OGC28694.1 MAG: hypothetical protein A3K49_07050 [candidate division WOR-1 bacterium RIFOXYC12_FULL_54_18]OGC30851.1 MAG: hypothetical protein A2346_05570 [candidate division WOR-1 bacterium R